MEELKLNPYRHHFLYAKHWYKKSNNIFEDLKKIQENYCGTPAEFLSDGLIVEVIIELTYRSIKSENMKIRWIEKLAEAKHRGEVIFECLCYLNSTPREIFGELGDPDPEILPLSKD